MPPPSVISGSQSVASTPFRKHLLSSKPTINISIPDTPSHYSTLDTITGTVTLSTRHPTPFSDISINLVGIARCSVDNPNAPGGHCSSDAIHRFLGMSQPISDDALPLPLVLQPGQTYTFPFSFVVPRNLLPRACSHSVNSQTVRDAHLQLPPSLNKEASAMSVMFGGRVSDYVDISYAIRARISQIHRTTGKKVSIVEASRNVTIRPSTEELPPLDVGDESSFYCLRKERTIRRGLVCAKQGRLSFMTSQPRSFRFSADDAAPSTYLRVGLRFDPANDAALPPRLGTLSSKLCATTHWATAVREDFPGTYKKESLNRMKDEWSDSLPLAALSVENVEWTKHDVQRDLQPSDHLRPASALSSISGLSGDSACGNGTPAPSAAYREGSTFYTAQVLLPISLPQDKKFLPTFHTCLISRVYALKINLSLDKRMCSNLELCVPVQVSAASSEAQLERMRQAEINAEAATDAEQVFEPRILSTAAVDIVVPEIRLRRTMSSNVEEPPDYEVLSYGFTQRRTTEVAV